MNEIQKKISDIKKEIIKNEEEEITEYYGSVIEIYKDIDKYLKRLDDINDKIYLAQWCNDYSRVNELIMNLQLTAYQRKKYDTLRENNIDINETINFKILQEKYSFLDNILDMIVTDIDIQDQILSLSDERLELFKIMYYRLNEVTDYLNPYIETILRRIGYVSLDTSWKNKYHIYDSLLADLEQKIKEGIVLSISEVDTLLYLCTSSVHHTVLSFNELQRFGEPDTTDQLEFKSLLDITRETKDIEDIKFLLLAQIYGINVKEARCLCNRYNISKIEITNDNKDIFEMYMAIYQIVNEQDFEVLMELYDEVMQEIKPRKDFRRIIVFENELRKAFAHDLNNKIYQTYNKSVLCEIDGVKIYDSGTDFKMIVTAIGAYQNNFTEKENYSKYWNSSKIRSHGNCCSLIGNSNLSMAKVKNIILGFASMSDNMLLLSGSSDINSTPDSRNFNTTYNRVQQFMDADTMLDNTRGDYNELVYERRDLGENPVFYKKNPDYIVFIEEYENFDEMLTLYKDNPKKIEYLLRQKQDQERKWQESIKAAKDFGIPIVKINREKIAKSEYAKIAKAINEFRVTRNPDLLSQIITQFENNRVGNCGLHAPIREKYFSQSNMSTIIKKLKDFISMEADEIIKNSLYFSLYKLITSEKEKVIVCSSKRKNRQIPGIDFDKEIAAIEQLLIEANIDYSKVGGRSK